MPLPQILLRVVAVGVAVTCVGGGASSARAQGVEVRGVGNAFLLNDSWSSSANVRFYFGNLLPDGESDSEWDPAYFVGDWNGDGIDSIAVRHGDVYRFRNSLSTGPAESTLTIGGADDVVVVGDWDGDGRDSFAVRRGNVYSFSSAIGSGPTLSQSYGRATDEVLVGDWNGDGRDTLAVRRGNVVHLKNDLASGPADQTQVYGRARDAVLTGDWNADGVDTLAMRRGNRYYLKDDFQGGSADAVVSYGRDTDAALAGDWDADGMDTLGVLRTPGGVVVHGFARVGSDVQAGTYRASGIPRSVCEWQRVSRLRFPQLEEDVLGSGLGREQIVTLQPSDVALNASGCSIWFPVDATYPEEIPATFDDGAYVVGRHIAPGTYTAPDPVPGLCEWKRVSGFGGTPAEVIQSQDGGEAETVTISPSDVGFVSWMCGEWEPA